MIKAIQELGQLLKQNSKNSSGKEGVDHFCDWSKFDNTQKIICIILRKEDVDNYDYEGIVLEDFGLDKPLLYRGGSSRGTDILPSSIITEPKKTLKNKILKWFKKRREKGMKCIYGQLNENKDKILEEIMSIYSNLNKDERHNVLLTIKIRESGTERHIGAIDKFKKFLIDGVSKRYYYLSSMGESKGEGICYLCNKRNELYGYVLPNLGFSFATADKPGFTPSLVQVDNWKNNPICKNCALLLERGMKFLNENLKYPKRNSNNYFRYEYYIIPKFTFTSGIEEIFGKLNKYIEHYQYEEYTDGLISKEDWVVNELMQENNILKMIFLFYTKKGGGKFIDIVNYIEDVIPSWIKLIFDLQKEIREHKIFQEEGMKNLFGKKWMGDFINGIRDNTLGLGKNNWFLVFLRNFFPQTKDHGTFDDQFLSILDSLLTNRKINRNLLINAFMREIRIQFKNKHSYSLKILAIKSLMLVSFLTKLGILENNNEIDNRNTELIIGGNSMEKIEELFEEFEIDDMTKRAAFIVGILVNYVLYIQRKEREVGYGEEPFWNKLYGLILDEAKIKNIFRESIAKLRQYKTSFLEIEELAAKYLASTEKNWNLNKDQISYYFSLGMSLAKALTVKKKEKNEK